MNVNCLLALTLALTPSLASAALFPKDTLVKMLDAKEFKKVMKENVSTIYDLYLPSTVLARSILRKFFELRSHWKQSRNNGVSAIPSHSVALEYTCPLALCAVWLWSRLPI